MSIFREKASELRRAIDDLTIAIMDKLEKNEFESIGALLANRLLLLKELIEQSEKGAALQDYLCELQRRDQTILTFIQKEQAQIKNTLFNIKNLNDYFTV